MEASNLVVPRSPTVGLLVGWVGPDRSSVAYSSGALSTASRLSILTTSLLLLEAPAPRLFLCLLNFRELGLPEAHVPQPRVGSSPTFDTTQKLTADRPYEVYSALIGSCLITLTGTLTGTGYRRITPYPAKHL